MFAHASLMVLDDFFMLFQSSGYILAGWLGWLGYPLDQYPVTCPEQRPGPHIPGVLSIIPDSGCHIYMGTAMVMAMVMVRAMAMVELHAPAL